MLLVTAPIHVLKINDKALDVKLFGHLCHQIKTDMQCDTKSNIHSWFEVAYILRFFQNKKQYV